MSYAAAAPVITTWTTGQRQRYPVMCLSQGQNKGPSCILFSLSLLMLRLKHGSFE